MKKYGLDPAESNRIEDYRKIKELNNKTLIGFHAMLSNKEFEKVVKAMGYDSFDDFLIENDYLDQNGQPSWTVWIESCRNQDGELWSD